MSSEHVSASWVVEDTCEGLRASQAVGGGSIAGPFGESGATRTLPVGR